MLKKLSRQAVFHLRATVPLQPLSIVDLPEFTSENPTTTHSQPGKKAGQPHASKQSEIDKFTRLLEQRRIQEGCAAFVCPGRKYRRCREGAFDHPCGIVSFQKLRKLVNFRASPCTTIPKQGESGPSSVPPSLLRERPGREAHCKRHLKAGA